MAWYSKTSGQSVSEVDALRVDISRDKYTSVVREENIATGYYVINTDKYGNKTTTWNQTGITRIVCKVKSAVVTWEYRGLTKAAADALIDNAKILIHYGTTYCDPDATFGYARWTSGLLWVEVGNCVGTIWHLNRRRTNEAGGYAVTVTMTVNTKI